MHRAATQPRDPRDMVLTEGERRMRTFGMFFVLPVLAVAQTVTAPPAVRGVLLEWDAQADTGELSVRLPDSQVLLYRFDAQTAVQRDRQEINVARLRRGEQVEVASDSIPDSQLRYARSIQVLAEPAPGFSHPVALDRLSHSPTSLDRILGTATMGIGGVVVRLDSRRVILHTRDDGDRSILFRPDTRFLEDGSLVKAADLKPNMRVFIRAGRTLYNEIEAYQVIWGRILLP